MLNFATNSVFVTPVNAGVQAPRGGAPLITQSRQLVGATPTYAPDPIERPQDKWSDSTSWGGGGDLKGWLFDPTKLAKFDNDHVKLSAIKADTGDTFLMVCTDNQGRPVNDWSHILNGSSGFTGGQVDPGIMVAYGLANQVRTANQLTALPLLYESFQLGAGQYQGPPGVYKASYLSGTYRNYAMQAQANWDVDPRNRQVPYPTKPPIPSSARSGDGMIYGVTFTVPKDFIKDPNFKGRLVGVVDPVTRIGAFYTVPNADVPEHSYLAQLLIAIGKTIIALVGIIVGIVGLVAGGAGIAAIIAGVAGLISTWYDFSKYMDAQGNPLTPPGQLKGSGPIQDASGPQPLTQPPVNVTQQGNVPGGYGSTFGPVGGATPPSANYPTSSEGLGRFVAPLLYGIIAIVVISTLSTGDRTS